MFSPMIVIIIGLPLTLLAIYALYLQVRDDHVAPIFVINLLISDLIQMCCMVIWVAIFLDWQHPTVGCTSMLLYYSSLLASACFMVCVALERYLIIAWPLWYRFRRSIKSSVVVSIMVWVFCFIEFTISSFEPIFRPIFLLILFPLLIFSLVGTLKALSAAISVSSKEKGQIIAILVLVVLSYTLLFLPWVINVLIEKYSSAFNYYLWMFGNLIKISPFADLVLYVFISKGATGKLLSSLCCCGWLQEKGQAATVNV
ncbi:G-protein coupled receptor 4-like [Lates calcarifer]|nr:G-protein coupled receptor 4-like [Lates calcarifer]